MPIKSMILSNREWQMDRQDSSHDKLHSFKSVKKFDWWNTTSSAGDWEGYIVQKLSGEYFLIPVFRENNYPRAGFTLSTGEIIAVFYPSMPSEEEIFEILSDISNQ